MFRTNCLICGSEKLSKIIDLGIHPFSDTFISESALSESEKTYPLIVDLCEECGQIQTKCITSPEERYSETDYSYTSSNSSFSRNYWDNYALEVIKKTNLPKGSLIVEIGSNDGYLSEIFLKMGYKVIGVDPSDYMNDLANKRGVETISSLFGEKAAREIESRKGKASMIIANNVFNHSDNPKEFSRAVSNLLSSEGHFISEQPYWGVEIENKSFDQIYHEHVSYFTITSLSTLLEKSGLRIKSAEIVDYHGGSLRTISQKSSFTQKIPEEVKLLIEKEKEQRLFDSEMYCEFMRIILSSKYKLLKEIYDIKARGIPIIALGAAAKGNTFLNFNGLDSSVIDYVTDASPHKKGKYTPLSRILIEDDSIVKKYKEFYALILAWNISDKIKLNVISANPKVKFIERN